jgi:PAS domain S-box-containing protein
MSRAELRRLVRVVSENGRLPGDASLSDEQVERLLQELGASYAELLAQNEELRELRSELEAERDRFNGLNQLKEELLAPGSLSEKMKLITNGLVDLLGADFARIWLMRGGDLCDLGCRHAEITRGPHACRDRRACLHLVAGSGRYERIDGTHQRVPFGSYKIGRVASGEESGFFTNHVLEDPRIHDREWARKLGLKSCAGYGIFSRTGEPIGVMALFSRRAMSSSEADMVQSVANTASEVVQGGRAEQRLREREALLKKTQAIGRIGSWELDLVANELIWSDEVYRLLGLDPEEFEATYEAFLDSVHPEDRAAVHAAYSGSVKSGLDTYEIEHRVVRRDNGEVRFVHEKCEHVRDASGRITRSIGCVQDITERKESERQLQMLRRSVEHSPLSIVVTDLEGKIEYVNSGFCLITGYSREEVLGENPGILKSGLHDKAFYKDLWETIKAGNTWRSEICNRKKNGSVFWEQAFISPVRNNEGEVTNFIAVKEDISDKKDLERLKEDVDRIMRHDLKTPLNSIVSLPQLLAMDENLTEEQLKIVKIIEESGNKMLHMIDLSLDMFKMEIGAYEYISQPVDALRIVERIIEQNRNRLSAKVLTPRIRVKGSERVGEEFIVPSEERLLDSLLSNLFVNALEASPKAEDVIVEFTSSDGLVIAIRNTGAVPEDIRETFFEKYRTYGKTFGTGLGTYSAKLMADTMGYELAMNTSDEENTTCVCVRIPSL